MKEVYVLHGRTHWSEAVYDREGKYFEESPCVEVYEKFEDAKFMLREYVIEAYNYLKECGAGSIVDDSFVSKTTEEDLFSDYNMWFPDDFDEDKLNELRAANDKSVMWDDSIIRDVAWNYREDENEVVWQMYCMNIDLLDDPIFPILAGYKIRKCVVYS